MVLGRLVLVGVSVLGPYRGLPRAVHAGSRCNQRCGRPRLGLGLCTGLGRRWVLPDRLEVGEVVAPAGVVAPAMVRRCRASFVPRSLLAVGLVLVSGPEIGTLEGRWLTLVLGVLRRLRWVGGDACGGPRLTRWSGTVLGRLRGLCFPVLT